MSSTAEIPLKTSSPPSSDYDNDTSIVATNDLGMIVDESTSRVSRRKKQQDVKVVRKKKETRKYVSKHFAQAKSSTRKPGKRQKLKEEHVPEDVNEAVESVVNTDNDVEPSTNPEIHQPQPQLQLQLQPQPRIFYGLNVDALSSDSELSDIPSDIGPDPFESRQPPGADPAIVKVRKKHNSTKSPYFPSTTHKHRRHFLTTLPFPQLTAPRFGLMQERLAHDPFRLLIATIFLNKTPGERAMPVFFHLMKQYPTPLALSQANVDDVVGIIQKLGLQNQRARKCIAMAKVWVDSPPEAGKRYRKLHYPCKGDGRDVKEGEVVGVDDERVAWEISHLPGLGPYSHDSWRMFCRDKMKGVATDWLGNGAELGFEPEWKRVLPLDKELRAWMTWMWLKEGWVWNKETGKRTKADEELLRVAQGGGVVHEVVGEERLVVKGVETKDLDSMDVAVEKPAGEFIPTG